MKKAIFVLNVDNYMPELCELTIPIIKAYASRIKADFIEITERKFLSFPPTYEKIQVYELGKGYDRLALIDADYIIHPKAPDILDGINSHYVGCMEAFDVRDSYNVLDTIFEEDGRYIGIAANFVVSTINTHEIWHPLDKSWDTVEKELIRDWNVDEYCLSYNLARYGFNWTGLYYHDDYHNLFKHIGTGTDLINVHSAVERAIKVKESYGL